ncbi:MAG: hypothetical protein KKB66_10945 [Alphaproteobacteria bacterium]|nr:hypothetical protein [Alphaproteobacteria bacterium]MBU0804917.1 hypothetical protein [Alphaproteobacteria bacterium]MBU0870416.1 hypothetical protein [Alphaproteobacteria bacterium]MBU1401909.1 hypothetical protein [Alphaproteobacteria bacterium]MBU1591674.1 hypothetical protein [Alphaproteobacteria bacterium]
MSLYEGDEKADNYGKVVAHFGPQFRVIVARHGLGWTLQQRRSKRGRWFGRAHVLQRRDNVAGIALSHMPGRYIAEHGLTQDVINKAVEGMPERFPLPTLEQLVIHTPPPRNPLVAASSLNHHPLRDIHNLDRLPNPRRR